MKKFYDDSYQEYGNSVKSLGWGSADSQLKRFEVIIEAGIQKQDSVLDVGCGFADFYFFSHGKIGPYYGIEKNKAFFEKCNFRLSNEKAKVFNIDFIDGDLSRFSCDWVIGSGIFCFDESNWYQSVTQKTIKLFNLCDKGLVLNFLSSLTDGKKKEGFMHANPFVLGNFYSEKITKKLALRHDYLKNDFTYYLYK